MNISLDESIKDLIFLNKNGYLTKKNSKDIWSSRAAESQNLLYNNLEENLIDFRRKQFLINENPRFNVNNINRLIPYRKLVYNSIIEKFKCLNDEEIKLFKNKLEFNHIGNPFYINYKNYIFNKRWLHNIHYTYLIKKYLSDVVFNKDSIILDIGGGYGILGYMLKKIDFPGTYILVEFPEQLIAAQYFLKSNFPNFKISNLKFFFDNEKNLNNDQIKQFDFFLCPSDKFLSLNIKNIDLVTNFFSFGEMSKDNFNFYIKSKILNSASYIFFINRFYSHNEYKNNVSILDYNLDKYEQLYFDINKMENTYIKQIFRYFGITKYTNSQFFEIIGKNEKN